MTVHDHNDAEFDDLLDQALTEYRDAEPLAGMELRLLERLRTRTANRKSLWLRWSLAAACLVVLVVAAWIGMSHRAPSLAAPEAAPVARTVDPHVHQPSPHVETPFGPSRSASEHAGVPHRTAAIAAARTNPNQALPDVFPVPVPLTSEEQAFVAALYYHPEAARAKPESDSTPVIAQIDIKPLSTSDEVPGENQ